MKSIIKFQKRSFGVKGSYLHRYEFKSDFVECISFDGRKFLGSACAIKLFHGIG